MSLTPTTVVIVPRVHAKHGLMLFLPYDEVNHGAISCWTPADGHNEASFGYYQETRAPWACAAEADRLVTRYMRLCSMNGANAQIVRRQKLPNNWRTIAWR